jgi:glutamate-ammonia-ligase adenylyltransferase
LYQVDPRLRPTGKSGPLATSLPEFRKYFAEGHGQLWERQALCKARVVFGERAAAERAMEEVRQAVYGPTWRPDDAETVRQMRRRLEVAALPGNLKRGPGGLIDIEFLVQMLQLKYGHDNPAVRVPSAPVALKALEKAGAIGHDDAEFFMRSFRFLRTLQARLRLMSPTTRNDLPDDPRELAKLAGLLGYDNAESLLTDCQHYTSENRRRFDQLFEEVAVAG